MSLNWTGSYESHLLRIIAGQNNLLALLQCAQERYGKALHTLSTEERSALNKQVMDEVLAYAIDVDPETLGMPPGGLDPSGKAH